MKKFLVPLFFLLLISCSSDGFDSQIAASSQKDVYCLVKDKCVLISKSLCSEIGFENCKPISESSSSGDDEISSSSVDVDVSSSSGEYLVSSSSFVVSSSSGGGVGGSSSSIDDVGSSSSVIVEVSSSSVLDVSSSSSEVVSSSSLAPPTLSECSSFPYYVAKTKKEYIGDLVHVENDFDRCEKVTYELTLPSNSISITDDSDSISFAGVSSSSSRTLNIRASVKCGTQTLTKNCQNINVVVADKFAEMNSCVNGEADKISIGSGTTTVEIKCVNSSGGPVTKIGCDNKQGNFTHPDDVFTLNNVKATVPGSGTSGWAEAEIPEDSKQRVIISYNKEMKCIGI